VAARVEKLHGLGRPQILLNASHTHYGPVVWPNLRSMYDLDPAQEERVVAYGRRLTDDLVALVGAALGDLAPAAVAVGHGSAGFAANRRQPTEKGYRIGVNPAGPVDHDVPVLKISTPDGKIRAVLFGYACHNTTIPADRYRIQGDWAGTAQAELERALPGATAMFLQLCGADQNPNPRGKPEISDEYGRALATEVRRVASGPMEAVRPPIRTACEDARLEFAPVDRAAYEREAAGTDRYRKARARAMLAALDAGRPVRHALQPVQVVRLGGGLAVVALGGEVVVDYALRLKRECAGTDLIVAGYSNDVMSYVPSLRVLREGGYEAVESMIYYGQPGPYAEGVEETVVQACRRLLERTAAGRKP